MLTNNYPGAKNNKQCTIIIHRHRTDKQTDSIIEAIEENPYKRALGKLNIDMGMNTTDRTELINENLQ